MTVSTIGTTGTYATVALWLAAAPTDITAAGTNEHWEGELQNETHTASALSTSGITTDSTHKIILRCATGASFRDHADVLTNPHRVDATKGALLTHTSGYVQFFSVTSAFVELEGLQIKTTGLQAGIGIDYNFKIRFCKIETTGNQSLFGSSFSGTGFNDDSMCQDCLFIGFTSNSGNVYGFSAKNYQFKNCGFYGLSPSGGTNLLQGNYGALKFENCWFFGHNPQLYFLDTGTSFINCSTDSASGAFDPAGTITSPLYSLTVSSEIASDTGVATTMDARLNASSTNNKGGGSNLGTTYNEDLDGQTRPATGAWDIGMDAIVAAAAVGSLYPSFKHTNKFKHMVMR